MDRLKSVSVEMRMIWRASFLLAIVAVTILAGAKEISAHDQETVPDGVRLGWSSSTATVDPVPVGASGHNGGLITPFASKTFSISSIPEPASQVFTLDPDISPLIANPRAGRTETLNSREGHSPAVLLPQSTTTTTTTTLTAGTKYTYGAYDYVLIPNTYFLMAWNTGTSERVPGQEIHFRLSCESTSNTSATVTETQVTEGGNTTTTWSFTISQGDDTRTATLSPENPRIERVHENLCELEERFSIFDDLWADGTSIYVKNNGTALFEVHDIGEDPTEITRNQSKDIPIEYDALAGTVHFGSGIFGDDAANNVVANTIWYAIPPRNLFLAYDTSTFRRVSGRDINPGSSIDGIIEDVYLTENKAYLAKGSAPAEIYDVSRSDNTITLSADTAQTLSVTNVRRATGAGDFVHFQVNQNSRSIAWQISSGNTIPTGFDLNKTQYRPANSDAGSQFETMSISTHDGDILYVLFPDGTIDTVTRQEAEAVANQLALPENSGSGTELTGFARATSQFPANQTWTLDADNAQTKCFTLSTTGQYSQTGALTTSSDTSADCTHDHEKTAQYTISATIDTTVGGEEQSVTFDINIDVTDVDEPPPPPTGLAVSPGPTSVNASWTLPTATGLAGKPPLESVDTTSGTGSTCPNATIKQLAADAIADSWTGIAENTAHTFCVRATNHEGSSDWVSASYTTSNLPVITGTTDVSHPENISSISQAFQVSDADEGHAITAVTITGDDVALFTATVTNDNQDVSLSFNNPPNYELEGDADTDNVYLLTITATSGTGDAQGSISEDLSITVTDAEDSPQGVPTIAGDAKEDSTLTASVAAVTDEDGIDSTSWLYQWQRSAQDDWSDISDAMADKYTLTSADAGQTVRVSASYIDGHDSNRTGIESQPTDTIIANSLPAFTGQTSISVAENSTGVIAIAAGDADTEDDIKGFSIAGDDSDDFSITGTGQLSFLQTPDFERPADDDSNNSYSLKITVTSGDDPRNREHTAGFTITVTNETEPPGKPARPSADSQTLSSLTFSWSAPANTGPAITGYSYRHHSGADWTTVTGHTSTSVNITGLDQNTQYTFQVNASNDEGTGPWSDEAVSTTSDNQPPDENQPPNIVQGDSVTRSIAENTSALTGLGDPLTVTDPDIHSGGNITWEITTPNIPFTITAGAGALPSGQLKTRVGAIYDHEEKPTYVFQVQVRDNQGGSDSIEVTVNVTDVAEPPLAPTPITDGRGEAWVKVRWVAPDNRGRPPITSYNIRYSKDGNPPYATIRVLASLVTHTITGLESRTSYRVSLQTVNDEGKSPWSDAITATTIEIPRPPAPPPAPVPAPAPVPTATPIPPATPSPTATRAPTVTAAPVPTSTPTPIPPTEPPATPIPAPTEPPAPTPQPRAATDVGSVPSPSATPMPTMAPTIQPTPTATPQPPTPTVSISESQTPLPVVGLSSVIPTSTPAPTPTLSFLNPGAFLAYTPTPEPPGQQPITALTATPPPVQQAEIRKTGINELLPGEPDWLWWISLALVLLLALFAFFFRKRRRRNRGRARYRQLN